MWETQRTQILTNVVMFIPVGVLGGLIWKWRGLIAPFGYSMFTEVLQMMTARGLCEIDDVIHNTLGALIGVGMVMMMGHVFIEEE